MFGSCKHEWKEIDRQVVHSRAGQITRFNTASGFIPEEFRDILYGYTLFFYKCTKCGKHQSEKITGALTK